MSRYAKALVALVPVLLAALNVVVEALDDDGAVTTQEWLLVAIAALTAVGVYAVPNRPPHGIADPGMSEQDPLNDRGAVSVLKALLIGLVIVVLLVLVGVL